MIKQTETNEQQQANENISLLFLYKPRAKKISQEINDLIRDIK